MANPHLLQHAQSAFLQGEYGRVIRLAREMIEIDDSIPEVWYWLAVAYRNTGKAQKASESLNVCYRLIDGNPDGLNSVGLEYFELEDFSQAERCFVRAIDLDPYFVLAISNLARIRSKQKNFRQAIALLEKAVELDSGSADLWGNLAFVYSAVGTSEDAPHAIAAAEKAISLNPKVIHAWRALANAALRLKRCDIASNALEKLSSMQPEEFLHLGECLHANMLCSKWSYFHSQWKEIRRLTKKGYLAMRPFGFIGLSSSPELSMQNAIHYVDSAVSFVGSEQKSRDVDFASKKVRIAFLSGEFRHQATSMLLVEVLECFDKNHFELIAFDNGWDDQSMIRLRLERAFNEIIDISQLPDSEAIAEIHKRGVHILVNLNGYFGRARTEIFAARAAPVQVNFLGFPGTMGLKTMDYIVVDETVLPVEEQKYYIEKAAYVDGCYQPNDSRRPISEVASARSAQDLPEHSFVFACFNNTYKITPEHFSVWMRILSRVPNSVLWLLADNDTVRLNLLAEAKARGIDPERLVFARRMKSDEHLKRHEIADLFLDTLPCNAHTTASDALWAGLPVLTCLGSTFPGRVAASLLKQLQLEELITENLQAYEDLAVELALNPRRLSEIKQKLAVQRNQSDLFNGRAYARKLESLFVQMYEKSCSGKSPEVIFSGS